MAEKHTNAARPMLNIMPRPGVWAAYAACILAMLYAAVSFYWAAGGVVGLSTVGGELERLARARDPQFIAMVWGTGVLKAACGLLALALVHSWGRVFPRWLLLLAAWGGAVLLTGYGGLLVVVQSLVVAGVIETSGTVDWRALWGHLLLWDLWFLLWGVCLGVAVLYYQRWSRKSVPGKDARAPS